MNLHSLAAGVLGAVHPAVAVDLLRSQGHTVRPEGTLSPRYAPPLRLHAQFRELSFKERVWVEGLALQGVFRTLYLPGTAAGLRRLDAAGGDLVREVDAGGLWALVAVPEQWPHWCRAIGCLQVEPP